MRLQRLVDLADQLAFAIAGAQLQAELLFLGGAVVRVGEVGRLVLHVRDGAVDFDHQVALPAVEDAAEVLELLLAHVLLAALDDVRLYVARTGQQAPRLERLRRRPPRCAAGGGRVTRGGRDVGGARRSRQRLLQFGFRCGRGRRERRGGLLGGRDSSCVPCSGRARAELPACARPTCAARAEQPPSCPLRTLAQVFLAGINHSSNTAQGPVKNARLYRRTPRCTGVPENCKTACHDRLFYPAAGKVGLGGCPRGRLGQGHGRGGLPAGLSALRDNGGVDPAAHVEARA